MSSRGRSTNLRLTAAILAALLAAMAGGLDDTGRGRRTDALGPLRVVLCDGPACAQAPLLSLAHGQTRTAPRAAAGDASACARALRRERLDRSMPSGAALLRTTSLPPPLA